MDAPELGTALPEAFRLGEAKDQVSRNKAVAQYQAIVMAYPGCFAAWFNLGVIQSRVGQWQAAIQSFSKAQPSPDLTIIAAFARLKLLVEHGREVPDNDFPEEFRGKNRGALGVQGPCHNAANELRNRGYDCTVEGKGESGSIVSTVGSVKYTITINDLLGTLLKNVWREEGSARVNLGDVKNLTDLDQEFARLEVGRLDLVQAPLAGIPGVLAGTTYRRLRSAALSKSGPHGWVRQGRSFEEVAAQAKAEAAQHGATFVQILSIEEIARSNCRPGTVFTCVLDKEPTLIAMLYEVRAEQLPTIRDAVARGASLLRGECFVMPDYPLVHLGLGIPVRFINGTRFDAAILESVMNLVEANFQDWVVAVEDKKYTSLHVFGPDCSHIAAGRMNLDAKIVAGIVQAVTRANSAFKEMPEAALDFSQAVNAFFEQHPKPFIWSA
jgi:hypothetical protein